MKLKYETGVATLVQFVLLTLLAIPNGLVSIITTCHKHGDQCATNSLASVAFFVVTGVWFGAIWILGSLAQERRSRILAYMLICAEGLTAAVALKINIKQDSNFLDLGTSIIDIILAIWVAILAFRLSRAKGGRIVASGRARRRRHHETPTL